MDSDTDCKIPLLEDIETAVPTVSDDRYPVKPTVPDDRYPVKPTRKDRRNCSRRRLIKKILKKVVKVMVVLFLIFATIVSFAGIRAYKWMAVEVKHWTVTEPNSLPTVDVSVAEVELFKMRAKLFWDTIQAGKIPKDFIASATSLNGLAASSDFLRGNAFAEMKTNEFKISVSLPADGLPGGKGRFLVGTETITWDPETSLLRLKMEPLDDTKETFYDLQFSLTKQTDGKTLNLEVVSGQAFEWYIPQDFIDEHNNLLEDLYDCDCHDKDCKRTRDFLEGLEISVEDDQVVFHPSAADQHRALRETGNLKSHHGSHWKAHLARRLLA